MRQEPEISEAKLVACLRAEYGFAITQLQFLPIGYDLRAFVFEASALDGTAYFVKIRIGVVALPGVLIPQVLVEHGIPHILAPLRTRSQRNQRHQTTAAGINPPKTRMIPHW